MDQIAEIKALISYYEEGIATLNETLMKIGDIVLSGSAGGEPPPDMGDLFASKE